jgi:16S rRNA (cytosine967-C5)-methyltransferase
MSLASDIGGAAGTVSRVVALDLLQAVLRRHRPLDQAIADHPGLAELPLRDRAFVRALVATTLRRLGTIARLLARLIERPLPARAATVTDLLRLGVCQLLFLRTAAHAAVDSTVALVGRRGDAGLKGLSNAVLRRLARDGEALLAAIDEPAADTPEWLWSSWIAAYGAATASAIAVAHRADPPLDLSVREDAEGWAARLGGQVLPTGSVRLDSTAMVEDLPGFAAGQWWVQDAAAALPARLFGPLAGRRVVDLCAAPGGKTAQLAAAGAEVVAVDRAAARLKRVTDNLARLGLAAATVAADATQWRPPVKADAVLLDAPCSATGTIRRHPDIPWLKSPDDVATLAGLQDRLLVAAVEMVAPGGILVYCTCSLQPEEGPERITALLARGARVERVAIRPEEIGDLPELITGEGDLRTLPCHLPDQGGLDGFYACRLRRV